MNKNQKIIVSMLVLAMLTLCTGASIVSAATPPSGGWTSYSALPWASNQLVSPNALTIQGSSTVAPVATEEINEGNFAAYWNQLVTSNPTLVGSGSTLAQCLLTASTPVSLTGLGSGTALPALDGSVATADVGEMSRPPATGSAEYGNPAMTNIQMYAIGVDSVAIVLSKDMTWFLPYLATQGVSGLTTAQVAELFAMGDTSATVSTAQQATTSGAAGTAPLFVHWSDFFTAQGWSIPSAYTTDAAGTIQRTARDPTSGTFDCFNNYFAVPNGYQFEFKAIPQGEPSGSAKTVQGSQEMAAFTYEEENSGIQSTISAGTNYIGFISLGYLLTGGGPQPGSAGYPTGTSMIGIPIAYNTASAPSGFTTSPLIYYCGSASTFAFVGSTVNAPTWGDGTNDAKSFVVPTDANVIYAYSGVKDPTATGQYDAWRWLWEVLPGQVPSTGPTLAAGVWVAYMMAQGTTNAGGVSAVTIPSSGAPTGVGSGTSNFVQDQSYIALDRDDMAGGQIIDSNLNAYTPLSAQTQSIPTGKVTFADISYFVTAYIAYYSQHIYNPYADFTASGTINFGDISAFVSTYINYYATYG